jgi:transcriptional regulator with XRE-family HTH domain
MQEAKRIAGLAAKLHAIKARGLARQADLEEATGVDQSVISRVQRGHRKRMSATLERLDRYADMLLSGPDVPDRVQEAARKFLVVGTESELVASIELARQLVARGLA